MGAGLFVCGRGFSRKAGLHFGCTQVGLSFGGRGLHARWAWPCYLDTWLSRGGCGQGRQAWLRQVGVAFALVGVALCGRRGFPSAGRGFSIAWLQFGGSGFL